MNFKIGSKCAVYGCNNYKEKKGKKYFFAMTRDVYCLKAWILACHRKDLLDLLDVKETDYFYYRHIICSDHFEVKCLVNKNKLRLGLRAGSIPTLNLYGDPNSSERNSADEIDKNHEGNSLGVIDNKPDRKSPDKIVNKPDRKSPDKIVNKPDRKSPDKIVYNPDRKSPDKIVNKPDRKSPDKIVYNPDRKSPDKIVNKLDRKSPDKIVNKPNRKSLDKIVNKPNRKSLDKIVNKQERKSLDKIVNKQERKSLDKIVNKQEKINTDIIDSYLSKSYADEIKLEEMDLKPLEVVLLKLSEEPCIFCGSMDNLRNLHSNNIVDNKKENYLQMILSCFSIKLVDPSGCAGLCEICVFRLRDAASFRTQVEAAGALLQQVKKEPTLLQTPEQQPTIEDNSSIYEIGEDVNTTFTYADFDTPLESGSQEVLEITWSEDEEAGRRQGRVEWIDQIPKYQTVESVEPKWIRGLKKCSVCDQVFKKCDKLKKHFELHLPKTLCEFCGRQFNFMSSYKGHLGIHLKEYRVSCPQCNASLASKTGLLAHVKTKHQGKKLFICPKGCSERFGTLYQRNEHLMKKHGVWYERYECPECSLVCYSPWKLDTHMRVVHLKEKNVECPECDRVFFNKSMMRQHLKTHSKERNFICDLCGKAFKNRVSIRLHLQIHYNIRDNPCPFCDAAFIQTSSLKYHVRTHHKDVASIAKRTRLNEETKKPEIVYTITYHEDEGTKFEDVIM